MEQKRCYYDDGKKPCVCEGPLWQCQTCGEWFCDFHYHETSLGYCVECVSCERAREHKRVRET